MKARVKTFLNERTQRPSVNAPLPKYYAPGDIVEIVDIINGDPYESNTLWFKLDNGAFIWSGGIEGLETLNEIMQTKPSDLKIENKNMFWWIKDYGIDQIWDRYSTHGENVRIGILDTGLVMKSPYFDYNRISGINLINNNLDFSDQAGHGTLVSSTIAANGIDLLGIAPYSQLKIIKFHNSKSDVASHKENFNRLIIAFRQHISDCDLVVLSHSFFENDLDKTKINELEQIVNSIKKTLFLCSNGDEAVDQEKIPGRFKNSLKIAAVDKSREFFLDSNLSKTIFISAPGVGIRTLNLQNQIMENSGSSFSTPFVAGIIALAISYLKKNQKNIDFEHLKRKIIETADKKSEINRYGNGIINPINFFKTL